MLSLDNYIPHRKEMSLLTNIVEVNDDYGKCEVIITPKSMFYDLKWNGVYNLIGIEYMAQTIAVYGGFNGGSKSIGLLLSVRKYNCHVPFFTDQSSLTIIAEKLYTEGGLGVFDCFIEVDQKKIATARLNTLQPSQELINDMFNY